MAISTDYFPVTIENVSFSNLGFIIFLKKEGNEKVLPIFIGAAEAHSIAAVLNKQDFPRPLSHDLFKNVLDEIGMEVLKIHVTELVEGTFYARIFLKLAERCFDVDSRPSDAIAIALRYNAPVFVHKDVYGQAAVMLDQQNKDTKERAEKIKEEMDKAVAEERYEDAARLRDELKKTQGGN